MLKLTTDKQTDKITRHVFVKHGCLRRLKSMIWVVEDNEARLAATIIKLQRRFKFFKSRSNFKVKVTRSKIMVPYERSCHKEYIYAIWKLYHFWFESYGQGLSFSKVGQTSRSRSQGQKLWYHVKGLVTRNTHMQYESWITSGLKDMAKVKFFVPTTDADGRAMTLAPQTNMFRLAKKWNESVTSYRSVGLTSWWYRSCLPLLRHPGPTVDWWCQT